MSTIFAHFYAAANTWAHDPTHEARGQMRLAGGWMGRAGDDTMVMFDVRCEHAVVSGEMGAHTADENTADTRSKLDALGCESTGGQNRELVSAMTFRKPGGSIALLSCTFDAINNISGRHTASQSEPDLSYRCSPLYRHVGWGFCDTARAVLDRNVDIVKSERDADNRSGGRPFWRATLHGELCGHGAFIVTV